MRVCGVRGCNAVATHTDGHDEMLAEVCDRHSAADVFRRPEGVWITRDFSNLRKLLLEHLDEVIAEECLSDIRAILTIWDGWPLHNAKGKPPMVEHLLDRLCNAVEPLTRTKGGDDE